LAVIIVKISFSSINSVKQYWIGCLETSKKDEFKLVAKILRVAAKGSEEGEIMDRCKLDAKCLDNYISALAESNLLTMDNGDGNCCYRTTEKGLQFLNTYHRLRWLLLGKDNDLLLIRLLGQMERREKHPFYVS
jgi:predicted transcriptional regulator